MNGRNGLSSVASGVGLPVRELLDMLVSRSTASPEIVPEPTRWRPADASVGDATRLTSTTGWTPRRPFEETLGALLEDWRERIRGGPC